MENNINPELKAKLDELMAKSDNGTQLNLEELDAVSGGNEIVDNFSQNDVCGYLISAYRDFGPQVAYQFAVNIFGQDIVEKVCDYLPYDVYGPETLREICRLVYSK
jgi:hypothetical protein